MHSNILQVLSTSFYISIINILIVFYPMLLLNTILSSYNLKFIHFF